MFKKASIMLIQMVIKMGWKKGKKFKILYAEFLPGMQKIYILIYINIVWNISNTG